MTVSVVVSECFLLFLPSLPINGSINGWYVLEPYSVLEALPPRGAAPPTPPRVGGGGGGDGGSALARGEKTGIGPAASSMASEAAEAVAVV